MQDYLLLNKFNRKNEEAELIFQLRYKTTKTKINMKGMYDSYEYRACGETNETQIHVLQCKTLEDMTKEDDEKIQYEKLYDNDVEEQRGICRKFKLNMNKLEAFPARPSDQGTPLRVQCKLSWK